MKIARNNFTAIIESGPVTTENANALIFINEGLTVFLVNGLVTVRPKDSFSINQVTPDITDGTQYAVSFQPGHPDSTGTLQKCVIVKVGIFANPKTCN